MPMSTLGTPSPWPLRRGRERGIAGGVLNLLVCAGLVAQPDQNPEPPPERASDASAATNEKENEGLWPSPKLLESLLSRWADEASNEYSLDDVQGKQVRKAVVGRWKGFLDEHRRELQPIANEFLEMRLGMEPPSKERVREWAERAFPTFDRVKQEFMASQDDFRQALHPTQRAKFELDMLKQSAGMQFAENKLRQWKTGDVDATEFWEPLPSARRRRGEEKHRHIEQTAPSSALGTTVGDAGDHPIRSRSSFPRGRNTSRISSELMIWTRGSGRRCCRACGSYPNGRRRIGPCTAMRFRSWRIGSQRRAVRRASRGRFRRNLFDSTVQLTKCSRS